MPPRARTGTDRRCVGRRPTGEAATRKTGRGERERGAGVAPKEAGRPPSREAPPLRSDGSPPPPPDVARAADTATDRR